MTTDFDTRQKVREYADILELTVAIAVFDGGETVRIRSTARTAIGWVSENFTSEWGDPKSAAEMALDYLRPLVGEDDPTVQHELTYEDVFRMLDPNDPDVHVS